MSEEIIKMAREAEIPGAWDLNWFDPYLERFFHMAQAAEREACALICEESNDMGTSYGLAQQIRARGAT